MSTLQDFGDPYCKGVAKDRQTLVFRALSHFDA
jgi:hypothetical protein